MAKAEGTPQIVDNPATPTVNEAAIIAIPFTMANGKIGKFYVVQGQVSYFNITTTGSLGTGGFTLVRRAGSTQSRRYSLTADAEVKTRTVRVSNFYLPARLNGVGGGKAIVVPTRLPRGAAGSATNKGFRTTSMRVSGSGLILADISAWLAANLKANEPSWFKTENGGKYAVVAQGSIADLNPGRNATTTPA